jgi:phosphoribosylglycinamide formyltransferase-1
MKRIAVLASGGGTNLQAVMDACARGDVQGAVELVIVDRKAAYARERARAAGIETRYLNKTQFPDAGAMDRAMLELLREKAIDVVVLAGYLSILGPETIGAYRNRILNTHPSLIPSFCGMGYFGHHVHQAVLDYGVKVSGCTVHLVNEQPDAGPIVLQEAVPVLEGDTAQSLAERILPVEHRLLPRAVAYLCADQLIVCGRKVTVKGA